MNTEFTIKYTIIESVINYLNDQMFSINDVLIGSTFISNKYNIKITLSDVLCVISNLYDSFEIDKFVLENGLILFEKSQMNRLQ